MSQLSIQDSETCYELITDLIILRQVLKDTEKKQKDLKIRNKK